MKTNTLSVEEVGIDRAWGRTLLQMADCHLSEVSPLQVTIHAPSGLEQAPSAIVAAADAVLDQGGFPQVHTVANTIFPASLWNPSRPRGDLYQRYLTMWPGIKSAAQQNRHGTYFYRLINYRGSPSSPGRNQLEDVIRVYERGVHRRSALQMAVFDPLSDLTAQPRRGFPCLHQVALNVNPSDGSLHLIAFYATQTMVEKALGNYVGLWRLGCFLGHELGLTMSTLTCIAAVGTRSSRIPLKSLNGLLGTLRTEFSTIQSP